VKPSRTKENHVRKRILVAVGATLALLGAGTGVPASADVGIVPIAVQAQAPSDGKYPKTITKPLKDQPMKPPPKGAKATSRAMAAPPSPSFVWWWAGGQQSSIVNGEGAFVGMPVWNTYKHSNEYHSIVSLFVTDDTTVLGGDKNGVAVAYGKSLACGQLVNPCILFEAWVNGVWQGWNSAHFIDWAPSLNGGDVVTGTTETTGCTSSASARNLRVGIRKNTTSLGWMIWADLCYGDATAGAYLGEYPASLWTSIGEDMPYNNRIDVFGESHTLYDTSNPQLDGYTCTDVGGNGYLATSANGPYPAAGQRLADVTIVNQANSTVDVSQNLYNKPSDSFFGANADGAYEEHVLTGQPAGNVRYLNVGGPGFSGTSGNTTPGVQGGC
jgi:hypothetical protein